MTSRRSTPPIIRRWRLTWMQPDFWAEDFQLRLGYSKTVARPDLREISDATYIDPLTEARIQGNPELEESNLTNYDLRAEWFFESSDNLTMSLFYKDIARPDRDGRGGGHRRRYRALFHQRGLGGDLRYRVRGPEGAWFPERGRLDGFVLRGRKPDAQRLRDHIGDAASGLTNDERPMTQHSDVVVNFQLGYDSPDTRHSVALAYNMYSERIFFAGRFGADDAMEQPFNSLDLTYSFHPTESLVLKLRLQNLLDEDIVIEQAGVDVLTQTVGLTTKLDLAYRF